jgi:hypothetical protein
VKKAYPVAVFVVLFSVFAYIFFPFEKIVERTLCGYGVGYERVKVARFPLKVSVYRVKVPSFPTVIDRVDIQPTVRHLFVRMRACGGNLNIATGVSLTELAFTGTGIRVQRCNLKLPVSIACSLDIQGRLLLSRQFKGITGGSGNFTLKSLRVGEVSLGILSFSGFDLGTVAGSFKVEKKNTVKVFASGGGKDAKVSVKGYVRLNPENLKKSYINIKLKIKPKIAPLAGKEFTVKLRGFAHNLRVAR